MKTRNQDTPGWSKRYFYAFFIMASLLTWGCSDDDSEDPNGISGSPSLEVQLTMVDADNDRITITNFDNIAVDIADYRLCSRFTYTPDLRSLGATEDQLVLQPGDEVTLDWPLQESSDVGLYVPGTGAGPFFSVATNMVDFMQFGEAGLGRENVAVERGIWTAGEFVSNPGPFTYTGDGVQNGADFWESPEGEGNVRIVNIDVENQTVTLQNFGTVVSDVSDYWFCADRTYQQIGAGVFSSDGDFSIAPDQTEVIDVSGVADYLDLDGDLGFFLTNTFADPTQIIDYVQWGADIGEGGRSATAVAAEIWEEGDFVEGVSPYVFGGNGNETGVEFWVGSQGEGNVRLVEINVEGATVTVQNFGTAAVDISNYWFCADRQYEQIGSGDFTTDGDFMINPDEIEVINVSAIEGYLDSNGDLGFFLTNSFAQADQIIDYVQWGADIGEGGRSATAVEAGIWDAAEFVPGVSPFEFSGNGDNSGADFWEGTSVATTNIRMTSINPGLDEVTLRNFDNVNQDISGYFFCTAAGVYPDFSNNAQVEIVSGNFDLAPGEEVTVRVLTNGGVLDIGSIFFFSSNVLGFNNTNPNVLRDFAQWGEANSFRVDNAIAAGRWDDAANFIDGNEPFNYIGDADDVGSTFWNTTESARVRLTLVNSIDEMVTLQNLGTADVDISDYWLCLGPGQYNQLGNYTSITGDLNLSPDETVVIDITSGSQDVTSLPDNEAGLGLFSQNGPFGSTDPSIYVDFVQWGAGSQNRASQAVTAGIWDDDANFADGASPYSFDGQAEDIGSTFWTGTNIPLTNIRISQIVPESDLVTLQNFDTEAQDISNYFFCTGPGVYPGLGNSSMVEVVNGDLNLAPGEEVQVRIIEPTVGVSDIGAIFLFSSNEFGFNNSNPQVLRDFAQWGEANAFRVDNAIAAGRWGDASDFIDGTGIFDYEGDADDLGSTFWTITDAVISIRLLEVNTISETVTISNLGNLPVDVEDYWLCLGPGQYNQLGNYATITGDLSLNPDEEVTLTVTSGTGGVTALPDAAAGLGLFSQEGPFGSTDPTIYVDFVQWGNGGQSRAAQAVTAGIWDNDANFVGDASPFTFNGGAENIGSTFWSGSDEVVSIRLLEVSPVSETVTIRNFGNTEQDISNYRLCLGPGQYNQLANYSSITGDLSLSPNEMVVIDITSGSQNVTALPDASAGLGLFSQNGPFGSTDPTIYVDFVQYGAGGQNRASQAVTTGIWDNDTNFVSGSEPFNFNGDGDDIGSTFWTGN